MVFCLGVWRKDAYAASDRLADNRFSCIGKQNMDHASGGSAASLRAPGATGIAARQIAPEFVTSPFSAGYLHVTDALAPPPSPLAPVIAALLTGQKWSSVSPETGKTVISYSFANELSQYAYSGASWEYSFAGTMTPFSDADRALTRKVLDNIEAVAAVEFVEVADTPEQVGVVRYAYSSIVSSAGDLAGYADFPGTGESAGDVWIDTGMAGSDWDFFRPSLILHETLHAIGLADTVGAAIPRGDNVIANTVMSYSPLAGATRGYLASYPSEPMPYDVAALQLLYGATSARLDDTTYDVSSAEYGTFRTLWDAGGTDTIDASKVKTAVAIDLNPGARSKIGVGIGAQGFVDGVLQLAFHKDTLGIAQGTVIENANGSAHADTIIGNAAANRLAGGAGNDTLRGGAGNDTLLGQAGSNLLDGGAGDDTAVYAGSRAGVTITKVGEAFTVRHSSGTDTLLGIERLVFDDARVALDLSDSAGTAARLVGALFGPTGVRQGPYVGVAISLLEGGMSATEVTEYGLNYVLGAQPSDRTVAELLSVNLNPGGGAGAATQQYLGWLQQGTYTHQELVQLVAQAPQNSANIDFVGLTQGGLAYFGG